MRILIVDDDLPLLDVMALVLGRAGHDVQKSPGGVSVLSEIRRNPPDVIITDLMMAELDGLAFCREITKDKDVTAKIIMISARTDAMWKKRAREAGAVGYIEKPINPHTFAAEVERLIADNAA